MKRFLWLPALGSLTAMSACQLLIGLTPGQGGGGSGGQANHGGTGGGGGSAGGGGGGGAGGGSSSSSTSGPLMLILATTPEHGIGLACTRSSGTPSAWRCPSDAIPTVTASVAPALTLLSDGTGIGLVASNNNNVDYVTWTGSSSWGTAHQVGTSVTNLAPSLVADGTTAHAIYRNIGTIGGDDHVAYAAGTWGSAESLAAIPPHPAATYPSQIAASASTLLVALINGDGILGTIQRPSGSPSSSSSGAPSAGSWLQTWQDLRISPTIAPALVGLGAGQFMVAFVSPGENTIKAAISDGHSWPSTAIHYVGPSGAPASTAAKTNDPIALSTASNNLPFLAFREADTGYLSFCAYASSTWSSPKHVFDTPVSVASADTGSPEIALAPGVGGATVELAYIDNTGKAFRTELMNNVWSQPVQIGTDTTITGVAIATLNAP